MAGKSLDRVLTATEHIHPLMGPIFTGRPSAAAVGEQCSMCLDPFPSDTALIDREGRIRYVCLMHELMLQRAFHTDRNGLISTDHYEAYVMAHIMQDAGKPAWMPAWAYARLTRRAAQKARLLALIMILRMANPLRYAEPTDHQTQTH
ncbi:hypothetical protein ACIQCM_08745 [Pseudarthrobacter sp. NPDC092439]|uniref:hypothetical protein n=1 Tax=unclassified Pseudarthrobacter TaxID=2647000 RepID=UPI003821BB82